MKSRHQFAKSALALTNSSVPLATAGAGFATSHSKSRVGTSIAPREDNIYSGFASRAEGAVRQETYGEDLGQSSWLTARERLEFADQLGIVAGSDVLEVGSGSGGPRFTWPRREAAA